MVSNKLSLLIYIAYIPKFVKYLLLYVSTEAFMTFKSALYTTTTSSLSLTPVSYTHLTLPTNREV